MVEKNKKQNQRTTISKLLEKWMEKWMKNGTFGEKRWKNGRKNGRKTGLFFTKIRPPVSGVEKWGETEVSGGLRKIGDFIGLRLARGSQMGSEYPRAAQEAKSTFSTHSSSDSHPSHQLHPPRRVGHRRGLGFTSSSTARPHSFSSHVTGPPAGCPSSTKPSTRRDWNQWT